MESPVEYDNLDEWDKAFFYGWSLNMMLQYKKARQMTLQELYEKFEPEFRKDLESFFKT